MIMIEFIQSPDYDILTNFKYFQNQLYLGRTDGDLRIMDDELNASHLMLEVIEPDLLIHPQKNVEFFLLNGKRASTIRKVKVGDTITIGKTSFKIINFSFTNQESKQQILDKKLTQLINEDSPRISIIESLTKLMGR